MISMARWPPTSGRPELDPAASDIWAELAALYARQSRPDEAVAAGTAALDRDPDNAEAHRTLGLVFCGSRWRQEWSGAGRCRQGGSITWSVPVNS